MSNTSAAEEKKYVIHPQKFTLWIFIVSIILFFGGLTSAYIVSKGIESENDMWHFFQIPNMLWYNTAVIIVSSVMLQVGVWGAKRGDFNRAKTGFGLTFLLGLLFMVGQIFAWSVLDDEGVIWGAGGSNSGNYLYILTAVHGFHIIAGLIYVGLILFNLSRRKYSPGKIVGIENCATFWHFLGLLWLYLFIFLLINQGQPLV